MSHRNRNTTFREVTLLIILASIVYFPFLDKAFSVEEPLYISVAQEIAHSGEDPFKVAIIYDNLYFPEAAGWTHAPAAVILNAIIYRLMPGADEGAFRRVYFSFYLLAVLAFYGLATTVSEAPLRISLLFTISPVVVHSAISLMPDLASFGCALVGLSLLLTKRAVSVCGAMTAALFLSLGWLFSYASLLITLVVLLAPMFRPYRRCQSQFIIAGGSSLLLFLLWNVWTRFHYGQFHLFTAWNTLHLLHSPMSHISAYLVMCLGSSVMFPLHLLYLYREIGVARAKWLIVIGGALLISVFLPHPPTFKVIVMASIFTLSGLSLGYLAFESSRPSFGNTSSPLTPRSIFQGSIHHQKKMFFAVWFVLGMLLLVVGTSFGAVRYTLNIICPLLLLLNDCFETRLGPVVSSRRPKLFVVSLLISTGWLSLALGTVDFLTAETYRHFFTQASQLNTLRKSPGTIYTIGKFGFQYYGDKRGYHPFVSDQTILQPGDILIHSLYSGPRVQTLFPKLVGTAIVPIASHSSSIEAPIPLRLVNYGEFTGFYCSLTGLLPYTISNEPLEEFHYFLYTGKTLP